MNSSDDVSLTDFAYCYNCEFYDLKTGECNQRNKPMSDTETCSYFRGTKIPIKDYLTQKNKRKEAAQEKKTIDETKYATITAGERIRKGVPEITWVIENHVPSKGITILGGASGSGKTWAGMEMAISVATGTDYLGQFTTTKNPVLFIDEENGDKTITSRLNSLMIGRELKTEDIDNIHLCIFNNIKLDGKYSDLILKMLIKRTGAKLVVLDSMVRLMEGDEDKSMDVRKNFETLKQILEDEEDVAFIILHHTTKAVRKGMFSLRGSGDFSAFADVVLIFEGRKGYNYVEQVKNRHADLSEQQPYITRLVEENKGLKLIWLPQNKADKLINVCADFIKSWLEMNNINMFETGNINKICEKESYKPSVIKESLNYLLDEGVIKRLKRGIYQVVNVNINEENIQND